MKFSFLAGVITIAPLRKRIALKRAGEEERQGTKYEKRMMKESSILTWVKSKSLPEQVLLRMQELIDDDHPWQVWQ
jgi:hypothetical protein